MSGERRPSFGEVSSGQGGKEGKSGRADPSFQGQCDDVCQRPYTGASWDTAGEKKE